MCLSSLLQSESMACTRAEAGIKAAIPPHHTPRSGHSRPPAGGLEMAAGPTGREMGAKEREGERERESERGRQRERERWREREREGERGPGTLAGGWERARPL